MHMQGINDLYNPHPLVKAERENRACIIQDKFGELIPKRFDDPLYSLYRFATIRPLLYVDHDIIESSLDYFNSNVLTTLSALMSFQQQISNAVFSLLRENPSWNREETLSIDSPRSISEFDSLWHPEYQRYSEHVLNHLIQIPLFILGKSKSKDYNSQTLGNRIELLRKNSMPFFCDGFDVALRNAISHGTVFYELAGIRYVDKNNTKLISHFEFSKAIDRLVTTCCSIVSATLLFLAQNWREANSFGLHKLPLGIRFLLIDGLTTHQGFSPISMVESIISGNTKQLSAVCNINSKSRTNQMFEALSLCRTISLLGGQNYDRYFISMQCGHPIPSSIVINGKLLRLAISKNSTIDALPKELFEGSLLWYDANRITSKFYIYSTIFKSKWKELRREVVQKWADEGLDVLFSKYEVRAVENNSSEKYGKIHAHIILKIRGQVTDLELMKISRHATKKLRKHRVKRISTTGEFGIPVKPQYIWLRIYSIDNRFRTLKSMSWANDGLVACAEWISSPKVMDYFYTKQYDLSYIRLRLKLNPSLIASK
jgi:hypothetical protein